MDFTSIVQHQRAFFNSGATRSVEYRRAQLQKLHAAIEAHETSLLEALRLDLGKSPYEAYATEIGLALSEIRHAIRHLPRWIKPERRRTPWLAWPAQSFLLPEPYGVVLIVGPWNYPVQLILAPLAGAVAAGNCVILKPSELAPNTAAALTRLLNASFPAEYLIVIPGERETAEALLKEKFDTIFFTGSPTVGRAVMTAAAKHLIPVTLELGGKCPCLVCADAPLALTARRIAWGKFMNAGQTCVAPDFLLVDQSIKAALIAALKQTLQEFYGEDPRLSPAYGRIINHRHFERLIAYLQSGQISHGGQHDAADRYLAPTILTDVPLTAPVMQEEIFGPILPVLDFTSLSETINWLRDQPVPLALYLFTADLAVQKRVLRETRSGGVCLNDTVLHMIGKDLPFGGLGESGHGAYHGRASFDCFSHRRSILRRSLGFDAKLRYPPPRLSLASLRRFYRFLLGD